VGGRVEGLGECGEDLYIGVDGWMDGGNRRRGWYDKMFGA
jgi:hypothetical protein